MDLKIPQKMETDLMERKAGSHKIVTTKPTTTTAYRKAIQSEKDHGFFGVSYLPDQKCPPAPLLREQMVSLERVLR